MAVTGALLNNIKAYEAQGYTPDEIVAGLKASPNFKDVAQKISSYESQGYNSDEILAGIKSSPIETRGITKEQTQYGILRKAATTASGFNTGVANLVGTPVDIVNQGMEAIELPTSDAPVLGSKWIKKHVMPEPIKPQTKGEIYLNAIGEQIPYILPGIGVASKIGQALQATKAGLAYALGAGTGSGYARSEYPDSPWADLLSQVVGGGAVSVTPKVISSAYRTITNPESVMTAVKQAAQNQANKITGRRLNKAMSNGPRSVKDQIFQNTEDARDIEGRIPGLQFNLGQEGGDPNLLSLTRMVGQKHGAGSAYSGESVIKQNAALHGKINKDIRGTGNTDYFIAYIQKRKQELSAKGKSTAENAEQIATELSGREATDIGSDLRNIANVAKQASSSRATNLYNKVPGDTKVPTQPLYDEINNLFENYDYFTQRLSATPTNPAKRILSILNPKPNSAGLIDPVTNKPFIAEGPTSLTMDQLKDFRSQMGAISRQAAASGDYELAYKANKLKDGVNRTLDEAVDSGKLEPGEVVALKEANDYYRDVHVPGFKQGATGKVLATDKTGGYRVLDNLVAGKYFISGQGFKDAANNFRQSFGNNKEALNLIGEYANQSLLRSARDPRTGELSTKNVQKWIYDHQGALQEYGLSNKYGSLQDAIKEAESARSTEAAFNKSYLNSVLNADPDKAIQEALTLGGGRKQSITRLNELTSLAAVDKTGAATAGLKAGIGEYFSNIIQNTARDLSGNNIDSLAKVDKFMDAYKPALKASGLYTKEELQAFDDVHKSILKISQQSRPHAGYSNSATADILNRGIAAGSSVMLGKYGIYGLVKSAASILEKPFADMIDETMAKACFDPRYAKHLRDFAMDIKKIGPEKAARRLTRRINIVGQTSNAALNNK